jgi:hypothetical protein
VTVTFEGRFTIFLDVKLESVEYVIFVVRSTVAGRLVPV